MKRFWFEDEGAVAVIVALSIFVLVAFTAVAVDVGYMYSEKRQLQTAADAAALAGCRVLADGTGDVQAAVDAYAAENSVAPGDALYVEATDIGGDYVQVTVAKDSPLFFAAVFGTDSSLIRASARAEVAYVTGLRGVVPLFLRIIEEPKKVKATITNGATGAIVKEVWLDPAGGYEWEANFSAPAGTSMTGYKVDVTLYNNQDSYPDGTENPVDCDDGVPFPTYESARILVLPPAADGTYPITEVSVSPSGVAEQGESVTLRVNAAAGVKDVSYRVNGDKKYTKMHLANAAAGLWTATVDVPDVAKTRYTSTWVDIKADTYEVTKAVSLVGREATYPLKDVRLNDYAVAPGGAVKVTVECHHYVPGVRYELRFGASETGNYGSFDLRYVYPTTAEGTIGGGYPSGPLADWVDDLENNPFQYYLENPLPFALRIGDTVAEYNGSMGNPIAKALNERIVKYSDVVYLPLVEYEESDDATGLGHRAMRIVRFAAFKIDYPVDKKAITGTFIDYVAPSDVIGEDPPAGDKYVKTVHLVAPE